MLPCLQLEESTIRRTQPSKKRANSHQSGTGDHYLPSDVYKINILKKNYIYKIIIYLCKSSNIDFFFLTDFVQLHFLAGFNSAFQANQPLQHVMLSKRTWNLHHKDKDVRLKAHEYFQPTFKSATYMPSTKLFFFFFKSRLITLHYIQWLKHPRKCEFSSEDEKMLPSASWKYHRATKQNSLAYSVQTENKKSENVVERKNIRKGRECSFCLSTSALPFMTSI